MSQSLKKVMILGSGALKIGEAGEFDYSGTQALKAMREKGLKTVLINPNIATVQTSKEMADAIYLLPVTPSFVEEVIKKERPDGMLLSFGGQTALNCGAALFKNGIFEHYHVKILGTPVESIIDTEDRERFSHILKSIDIKTPQSIAVTTVEDALSASKRVGFPVIIRSAFTLGGQGSAFCENLEALKTAAAEAFAYSPQILVEESLKGWKEIEYEIMRDSYDNCIAVCNMENMDPLGIHTGESIVVAPSQTLSDTEYHALRSLSFQIARKIGIVGECNVQFALNPKTMDYRVIEVNARLSRSSALASKATGYPIAFVAAMLSLGLPFYTIENSVTGTTKAFFEPALDYIVCKLPRWDLEKFPDAEKTIGTAMKSVGEVMAIGKTFEEAIQKGLRMIGQNMHGLTGNRLMEQIDLIQALTVPDDKRIFAIAKALEKGMSIDEIHTLTAIDPWFLKKLKRVIDLSKKLSALNYLDDCSNDLLSQAKQAGFSDFQIARFVLNPSNKEMEAAITAVRVHRKKKGVLPCVKQIDTMAGEFPAKTNYLYLTYGGKENDITIKNSESGIIVLGAGTYRIGSSVEFDWLSVNALSQIKKEGFSSIMINNNPETVSTDYDGCDRLYFDELSFERVMDIIEFENPLGVLVSFGGQIPNNLAMRLHHEDVKILGTSPESIHQAENRENFSAMLDTLGIDQPRWQALESHEKVHGFAQRIGYPVLIRPSYVLSGSAMKVVNDNDALSYFLNEAVKVSKQYPVVVSEFIPHAIEVEVDAVALSGNMITHAISEHVEHGGVHSGDATLIFPPQGLSTQTLKSIGVISQKIAQALFITGPFNLQLLIKNKTIKVIECNLRASRSVPFVSKIMDLNFVTLAIKAILGKSIPVFKERMADIRHVGVKAAQFSYSRIKGADPLSGVNMGATGEVGCLGENWEEALLTAMHAVGVFPPQNKIFISGNMADVTAKTIESIKHLIKTQVTIYAIQTDASSLLKKGIAVRALDIKNFKTPQQLQQNLLNSQWDLIINLPASQTTGTKDDRDYLIRRFAVDHNIPLITNSRLLEYFLRAVCHQKGKKISIKNLEEYLI